MRELSLVKRNENKKSFFKIFTSVKELASTDSYKFFILKFQEKQEPLPLTVSI